MLTKSQNHNINYLAAIVAVDSFRPHPNADKLKIATVFGNNLITGIDASEGLYVYFPVESCLSEDFLAFTNSFRENEKNADKTKKGFFEYHGRVKPIKLRGVASEGYMIPLSVLQDFCKGFLGKELKADAGQDFDTVFDHILCKKYVPRNVREPNVSGKKTKGNVKRYETKLVENQFRFHEDTSHLKREMFKVSPDDYVSITNKLHGCNFIVSHVRVKRKLSLLERLAKKIGIRVEETEYGMLYSSRAVIKNQFLHDKKEHNHFYDADVWKIVAEKSFPLLRQGISIVGEIVGYTPNGGAIQKGYDYGCEPNNLDFYVFKVTYTSPSGDVYVFNHRETVAFCEKYGLKMPETFFYGKAKDLFPEIPVDDKWHDTFLQKMIDVYLEKKCHLCKNDVWAEGVILRKEVPHEWDAFKLKSFNFLGYESALLDSGEVDLETTQSSSDEEDQ
jgi:tRNA-binding EMAP/Myf-like protein